MDKDSKKRITANRKRVVNRSVNVDRPEITSIVLKTASRRPKSYDPIFRRAINGSTVFLFSSLIKAFLQ